MFKLQLRVSVIVVEYDFFQIPFKNKKEERSIVIHLFKVKEWEVVTD